jgi:hypothetical protein
MPSRLTSWAHIISRNNDVSIEVRPGPGDKRGSVDHQVRHGNRWRVVRDQQTCGEAR